MRDWIRRGLVSAAVVGGILLVYAILFQLGMDRYEDRTVTFAQAIQQVVEAITTAGFGGFSPWESWQLNLLIVAMNVSGVLLVFIGIPVFFAPLIREALKSEPPSTTTLTDHVIICSHSRDGEIVREELQDADVPSVFLEPDEDTAGMLAEQGIDVVWGDPERSAALQAANLEDARGLVVDIDDETNPSVIITARQLEPELEIFSVVHDHDVATYHRYAGADRVIDSRRILGESLASRATNSLAEELREVIGGGDGIQVREVLVQEYSQLVGQSLAEADLLDELGITVVGMWIGGKFVASPHPSTRIEENTILLVVGDPCDFDQLDAREIPPHWNRPESVVLCGYGAVGRITAQSLEDSGIAVRVADTTPFDRVDVVGDVTEPDVLDALDVNNAQSVVLALDDDRATIFTTLVLEKIADDIELIVRASDPSNVWKLYNAGADYVLSLSAVTGEMLAAALLEERQILTAQMTFDFVRTAAPALADKTLAEADVRNRTGCTIIAVEREGELLTQLGPTFTVRENDVLVAVGAENAIDDYCQFVGADDA